MDSIKDKKFRTGKLTNPAKGKFNRSRSNHGMMQLPNFSLKKHTGKKDGGIMKAVDKEKNPGLAKLPTEVRNKMGYMKKGGAAHSDMAKDKPMMKAEAKKAVKGHEKRMHGMAHGGVTRADGIVKKGHTKGKMIGMKKGGAC
jgi:hypothetical protein